MMYWLAGFSDASTIAQFDDKNVEHMFKEVEEHELAGVRCLAKLAWIGQNRYMIDLKEGEKAILFRRHTAKVGGEDEVTYYGLGIEGKFTMLIDPSGNVEFE